MRGKFITVEGQDGAGKSTNLAVIEEQIRAADIDLVVTREPGGTEFGERIRDLVLSSDDEKFGDMAELLMIFAARAEHIKQVIEPALSAGKWVLSDRFTDATFAYQGGGRGMNQADIEALELLVQKGLKPDLTILLDVPVEVGQRRAGQRSEPDRFESQQNAFKNKVRECYLNRAKNEPERFRVVDSGLDIESVAKSITDTITLFLNTSR